MSANLPLPSINEDVSTTLSSGITDVATSMDVGDATKIPDVCYLVIDRVDSAGNLKATSLWEYVKVTGVAGNTCTITRGQGGSTNQSHGSGAVVEAVVTGSMFEDWYAALNPEHTATGGHVIATATITNAVIATATITTLGYGTGIGTNLIVTNSIISNATISNSLNVSGASITGLYPSGASGSVLTSVGNTLNPVYAIPSAGSALSSKVITATRDLTAANGDVAYTGVGFKPSSIIAIASVNDSYTQSFGMVDSLSGMGYLYFPISASGKAETGTGNFLIGMTTYASNFQTAQLKTFDTDGFTLTWAKNGTPSGTFTMIFLCFR